mgnify:CR=1 FL=1
MVASSYYRILTQLGTAVGTTYVSSMVPIMAKGHNGYHLAISHVGSGTSPLKILITGGTNVNSPWAHEVERGWVLSPQNSANYQGFVTGYFPFPYMRVEAITDALTVPLSAQITIDCIPLDDAVPPVGTDGTYGTMASWNGTARHRVRGSYSFSSGIMTTPISGGNAFFSMYLPTGRGVRTIIREVEVIASFNGQSGTTIADTSPRAVQMSYIASDQNNLTVIGSSLIRANDTVMVSPLTIFRVLNGGSPASLDLAARVLKVWIIPNVSAPPVSYKWSPITDDLQHKVIRPSQGVGFWMPVATVSGDFFSVNVEVDEEA